jgi:hypothetical protein
MNGSAPQKSAQKREEQPAERSQNRRDKALELFLDGKISNGELEQILAREDGPQHFERATSSPIGYA